MEKLSQASLALTAVIGCFLLMFNLQSLSISPKNFWWPMEAIGGIDYYSPIVYSKKLIRANDEISSENIELRATKQEKIPPGAVGNPLSILRRHPGYEVGKGEIIDLDLMMKFSPDPMMKRLSEYSFFHLTDSATDNFGDEYYIDFGSRSIKSVSRNGRVRSFSTSVKDPIALALTKTGDMYVADYSSGVVICIDKFGSERIVARNLEHPIEILTEPAGRLVVVQLDGKKIQIEP